MSRLKNNKQKPKRKKKKENREKWMLTNRRWISYLQFSPRIVLSLFADREKINTNCTIPKTADNNAALQGCRQPLIIVQTVPDWARDQPGQRQSQDPRVSNTILFKSEDEKWRTTDQIQPTNRYFKITFIVLP